MPNLLKLPDTKEIEDAIVLNEERYAELVNLDKIEQAASTLNEEQRQVFDSLHEMLKRDDKEYAVIIGYAGTGKTYMLSKFVSCLRGKVAMTAPTNKAVKVLAEHKLPGVDYATIHKLLALRMKWIYPGKDDKWKPFQKLVPMFKESPAINSYDVLIIDEVSMLDDELFNMINDIKSKKLKVIFMGDPAQIPPVNKNDSIPLLEDKREEFDIDAYYLSKVMRQKGDSKILEVAYQVRNNRFNLGDPILTRVSAHDICFLSASSEDDKRFFIKTLIEAFTSNDFKQDSNYCKLIAWTNKTVNAFNALIRKQLFKGFDVIETYMPGEKLIADSPVIDGEVILFQTSEEFAVVKATQKRMSVVKPSAKQKESMQTSLDSALGIDPVALMKANSISLVYWDVEVTKEDEVEKSTHTVTIKVLDESSEKDLKNLISLCYKAKDFDGYKYYSEYFAKVKYNYAITAHKSQGSTYGTVFIIEDDIDKNKTLLERNRIKYTAITRPKEMLYVLSYKNMKFLTENK